MSLFDPQTGVWLFGDSATLAREHIYDARLANGIVDFLGREENARSVYDFGCGTGDYVRRLRRAGFMALGYDGNPHTREISGGIASVLDLSVPVDLDQQADWVLCLEVGEHVPAEREETLIANLARHARLGIILSWCIPEADWPAESGVTEEKGLGHVNCRTNEYIQAKLLHYGFAYDAHGTCGLRAFASSVHFKFTLMLFRCTGVQS